MFPVRISAQDEYRVPEVHSPDAAGLGTYGKIPVGLFTGIPSVSVPLLEVKGKGITLPVYLTYHPAGIRPDIHPGWTGVGWTLHAGGCINRIVNGIPDETSEMEYEHRGISVSYDDPGYMARMPQTQSKDWTAGSNLTD